jgi:hypothetical protein
MAIKVAVNRALTAITALPTAAALTDGNLTLLTTATASSSATLDFTSNIDSTYDSYLFKFINCHPASDNVTFQVGFRDGSTAYDATKTTTFFRAYQYEDNSGAALAYVAGQDLAQSTNFQSLTEGTGGDNDQSCSGTLHLFNPSSTTFVKHFIATVNNAHAVNLSENVYVAGYCNVTAAIDAVQFKFSSGNIDSGTIKMYGVGDKQS